MIYLASPYSHPDGAVRERRFRDACRAAAVLLRSGRAVFSPIIHGHPLVEYGLATDWSFWQWQDREHLAPCDEVVVLMLDGWQESVGLQEEIRIGRELSKPVRYVAPEEAPGFAHVRPRRVRSAGSDKSPNRAYVRPVVGPTSPRRCGIERDQREETPPGGLVGDPGRATPPRTCRARSS
jgi:Domain of unknown function (DUF1937)